MNGPEHPVATAGSLVPLLTTALVEHVRRKQARWLWRVEQEARRERRPVPILPVEGGPLDGARMQMDEADAGPEYRAGWCFLTSRGPLQALYRHDVQRGRWVFDEYAIG